jgi:hypothetical protein
MMLSFAWESEVFSGLVRLGNSNPTDVQTDATALGHLRSPSQ